MAFSPAGGAPAACGLASWQQLLQPARLSLAACGLRKEGTATLVCSAPGGVSDLTWAGRASRKRDAYVSAALFSLEKLIGLFAALRLVSGQAFGLLLQGMDRCYKYNTEEFSSGTDGVAARRLQLYQSTGRNFPARRASQASPATPSADRGAEPRAAAQVVHGVSVPSEAR